MIQILLSEAEILILVGIYTDAAADAVDCGDWIAAADADNRAAQMKACLPKASARGEDPS